MKKALYIILLFSSACSNYKNLEPVSLTVPEFIEAEHPDIYKKFNKK